MLESGYRIGMTLSTTNPVPTLEQHLHEARTLITQAQEAAERGDERQVQTLISQVKVHTTMAIEGSKEQKK